MENHHVIKADGNGKETIRRLSIRGSSIKSLRSIITQYKWIEFINQKAQGSLIKTRPNHMLPTGNSFQLLKYTQAQSEGIIKNIPGKQKPNESRRKSSLKTKGDKGHYIMINWSIHREDTTQ